MVVVKAACPLSSHPRNSESSLSIARTYNKKSNEIAQDTSKVWNNL